VWTVAWGKILTGDNLIKRVISLVDRVACAKVVVRLVDHKLLRCDIAYEMWTSTFLVFGVQLVMPKGIVKLLSGWRDWFSKYSSFAWNFAPLCLLWTLSKERNQHVQMPHYSAFKIVFPKNFV
jgi:hypothetical protein